MWLRLYGFMPAPGTKELKTPQSALCKVCSNALLDNDKLLSVKLINISKTGVNHWYSDSSAALSYRLFLLAFYTITIMLFKFCSVCFISYTVTGTKREGGIIPSEKSPLIKNEGIIFLLSFHVCAEKYWILLLLFCIWIFFNGVTLHHGTCSCWEWKKTELWWWMNICKCVQIAWRGLVSWHIECLVL